MTALEAFERAYKDGRAVEIPGYLTDWNWLEQHLAEALAGGNVVAAGFYAGRLSRRGESVSDVNGMAYTYEW